jgi:hypothetical protein
MTRSGTTEQEEKEMPAVTATDILDEVAANRRLLDTALKVLDIHGQMIADIHAAVTKEAPAETDSLGDILRHILVVGDANGERLDALRERMERVLLELSEHRR